MGEGAGGAGVGTTLRVAVEADGRHQGEGAIAVCAMEVQTTGLRAAAARVSACWQGKPRRLRAQGSYKDYQVPYVSRHSFVHSRFRCAAAETR